MHIKYLLPTSQMVHESSGDRDPQVESHCFGVTVLKPTDLDKVFLVLEGC